MWKSINIGVGNKIPISPQDFWTKWCNNYRITWLLDKASFLKILTAYRWSPWTESLRRDDIHFEQTKPLFFSSMGVSVSLWRYFDSFPEILIPNFQFGAYITLSGEAGVILKCWTLHWNTSLIILFRQIWLAIPVDLTEPQSLKH